MVIRIPRGYISPLILSTSLHPVHLLYFSSPLLLPLIASYCLCLTTPCLSLPVALCSLFASLSFMSRSGFFSSLSLNVFFCSHLTSCFSFSLLSSVPVVLTSCPAVEGGRSRGGKGMLILSPQRRRAEGEIEKEREKMSLV